MSEEKNDDKKVEEESSDSPQAKEENISSPPPPPPPGQLASEPEPEPESESEPDTAPLSPSPKEEQYAPPVGPPIASQTAQEAQMPQAAQTPPAATQTPQATPEQPGYYQSPDPYRPPASYQPPAPGSGKATASLICGVLAILFFWVPIIGIVLGIVAIVLAVQYVKAFGKESKATGGQITGILGIVFSFLFTLFIVFGAMVFAEFVDDNYGYYYSSSTGKSQPYQPHRYSSTEEQALEDQATELMDDLCALDKSELEEFAQHLDKQYSSQIGTDATEITFADMGVDQLAFAKQWVSSLTYEIDEVEAIGDVAYVHLDLTYTNDLVFSDALTVKTTDYFAEKGSSPLMNNEYILEDLGTLVSKTLTETTSDDMSWGLLFLQEDGEWVVSQSSYDSLEYLLYGYSFNKELPSSTIVT